MFKKNVKPEITCLTKVYQNRLNKIGVKGGIHVVYRLFVLQHFGIMQGYVGVSTLNIQGLILRYMMECYEASIGKRKHREVYNFLWRYNDSVKVEILQAGLTARDAYALEGRLRPFTNRKGSADYDRYNWNTEKGGNIPGFLDLEKIEAEEAKRARKFYV
jgi:hypothetical protein